MNKYIVQHRRGTAAQWAAYDVIIPKEGELVIEIDEENSLHKLKIGDGKTPYNELAYLMAGDEIVNQVLAQVPMQALPRIIKVTLDKDKWIKVTDTNNPNLGYFGQKIELTDITQYSRLDLQPSVDMLAEFQTLGIVFSPENKNNEITVYSLGNQPLQTYEMQATIVETNVEIDDDVIVGIPVGAASSSASNTIITDNGLGDVTFHPTIVEMVDIQARADIKKIIESSNQTNGVSISLKDTKTDISYKLYVANGQLTMEESEEPIETNAINLTDIETGRNYKLYIENGKFTMGEVVEE